MRKSWVLFLSFALSGKVLSQGGITDNNYYNSLRSLSTAVPIIAVSPDSRAGGMGDVGVASAPDPASIYWNPAKLAFLGEGANSLSLSYTPWLNKLVSDIDLAYLAYAFSLNDRQGMAAAIRYFSLGDINFTDGQNNSLGTFRPHEFTLNAAYALRLSNTMSLAVGLRYIFSNLTQSQIVSGKQTKPGKSFAADIGYYFQSREYNMEAGMKQSYAVGINISNIGGKITYSNDANSDFIPTNLRVGGAYNLRFDKYNRVSFLLDFNKLLVPSPEYEEKEDEDKNGNGILGEVFGNEDVTVAEGIFQSFIDAPGGAREEMEEININVGAEFWYDDNLALRGGYQHEDEQKGDREYFTIGVGLRYNVFGLDLSYLIPASATRKSPIENTLRFTLIFDFKSHAIQK